MIRIRNKLEKKTGNGLLFVLFFLIAFVRYGLQIDIPTILMLGIALIIVISGNNNEIIAMCMCCIPFYSSFDYLYVILIASIFLAIKNYRVIKINFSFIIMLLIFIWELVHGFVGEFSIKQFIIFVTPYLFLIVLQSAYRIALNYNYITSMFSISVVIAGIILLFKPLVDYRGNIVAGLQQLKRLGSLGEDSLIVGGQINPNSLGIMCTLAIAVLLQNYYYEDKERKNLVVVALLMILGLLTQSRTYFVLLFLLFILFTFAQSDSRKKRIKLIGTTILILVISGLVLRSVFPTVADAFWERWKVDDLSNGRLAILTESFTTIWSSPRILLFGVGLQNYSEKVLNYVSIAPHDAIHELLMVWGIPGLIMFVLFIGTIVWKEKYRNINIKLVNYIPLILMCAKMLAGHCVTSGYTMLAISLVYLSLSHDFKTVPQKNTDFSREND